MNTTNHCKAEIDNPFWEPRDEWSEPRFKHSLLLIRDRRRRNAALGKFCLDLEFLIGYKSDFGLEGLVSSQANRDLPSAGATSSALPIPPNSAR
jgi:hypothetical protein